jgi:hypothetical protein
LHSQAYEAGLMNKSSWRLYYKNSMAVIYGFL